VNHGEVAGDALAATAGFSPAAGVAIADPLALKGRTNRAIRETKRNSL